MKNPFDVKKLGFVCFSNETLLDERYSNYFTKEFRVISTRLANELYSVLLCESNHFRHGLVLYEPVFMQIDKDTIDLISCLPKYDPEFSGENSYICTLTPEQLGR